MFLLPLKNTFPLSKIKTFTLSLEEGFGLFNSQSTAWVTRRLKWVFMIMKLQNFCMQPNATCNWSWPCMQNPELVWTIDEQFCHQRVNAIPVLGESPFHFPEANFSYAAIFWLSSTNVSLPGLVSGVRDVHKTKYTKKNQKVKSAIQECKIITVAECGIE